MKVSSASRRSARVELLAAAVFDGQRRFLEFSIASRARSSNAVVGFGHSQMGEVHETRIVPALTLDEMLAIAPLRLENNLAVGRR